MRKKILTQCLVTFLIRSSRKSFIYKEKLGTETEFYWKFGYF